MLILLLDDKSDIKAKQRSILFPTICYDELVWSFGVCSSMSSWSLASSTTKHTFDTHHKVKQRRFLFSFHCCYLRFESYYFTWLICLEMLLFKMQQFLLLSNKHVQKSIYTAHSTSQCGRLPYYSPFSGCGEGCSPFSFTNLWAKTL